MLDLALALLQRLGGLRLIAMIIACLTPLALMQCSRMKLESLREDYRALESDNATLSANLEACRAAAGQSEAALTAREREALEITNKYTRLREEFLRALLPPEATYAHPSPSAPEGAAGRALPAGPSAAPSSSSPPPSAPPSAASSGAPSAAPVLSAPSRPAQALLAPPFPAGPFAEQAFPLWCAQPVPALVRGLLANPPANPALPRAAGSPLPGD